jgi:hypothetical protein
MPLITSRLPLAPYSGTAYILGNLVLPVTVGAVCEVTSIVTLGVSVQRRQWGGFAAGLLCLVVQYYASLAIDAPGGLSFAYRLFGYSFGLRSLVTIFSLVTGAPLVVFALAYAWTRRQPALSSASV